MTPSFDTCQTPMRKGKTNGERRPTSGPDLAASPPAGYQTCEGVVSLDRLPRTRGLVLAAEATGTGPP